MIICKTPFRVSLFGGGTDFPDYFDKHKSYIIGSSIDKYIYITLSHRSSHLFKNSIRFAYSKLEFVNNINEVKHTPFKEIVKYFGVENEFEVNLASDLPSFSGMGSSSAFTVGLINAFNYYLKLKKTSKKKLADTAINIERNILKEYVGYQDQIHAAFGGFNLITFSKKNYHVRKIKITEKRKKKLSSNLFLVYTKISRKANNVEKNKFSTLTNNKFEILNGIKDISIKALDVLENNDELDKIGHLLDESWHLKKSISSLVSNSTIDNAYNYGIETGALGGKLLGAGSGGFILFYVPNKNKKNFLLKNKDNLIIDFNFEESGSKIISIK